jgi:predicted ATP-dependent protease
LVDNSSVKGAPVVFEHRPTFSNLFGKIERRLENGVYLTDFTMVRSGSLMEASGGFLILNVLDLFHEPGAWDHLKSCLRNREVSVEDPGFLSPFLPTTGLKPEPMPVHTKIILLGSHWAYYVLYRADEDFRKIFQVLADFDDEIDRTAQTCREYAQFVATTCNNNNLLPVTRAGVGALIEEGSRLVDSKDRLTLKFNDIANLVIEADLHARESKAKRIARKHIEQAIREREHRSSLVADKLLREIDEGRQLIDVDGEEVGQINGLAVYSAGALRFGKPCRITANTYAGKSGIINIEREAKLSGRIHDKGVYIINGYLGHTYAQNATLSINVTVCFEQSYGGIDGDSASSTELYAILSSLSDVPIKQGIAVTGSVNQKGIIQPIGGVNEKIEGFFKVCANRGLTGNQGVIIPHQNVSNMMLRADVREAVAHNLFHIWPVKTVGEGIAILTGVTAGTCKADGTFTKGSIHDLVAQKLKHYAKAASPRKKDDKDKS